MNRFAFERLNFTWYASLTAFLFSLWNIKTFRCIPSSRTLSMSFSIPKETNYKALPIYLSKSDASLRGTVKFSFNTTKWKCNVICDYENITSSTFPISCRIIMMMLFLSFPFIFFLYRNTTGVNSLTNEMPVVLPPSCLNHWTARIPPNCKCNQD